MTWFFVEDNLAFHPKTLAAGNAAMGLWVRAGSWCGQQLTDGEFPADMARKLGTAQQSEALVRNGFWVPTDTGFQFHQWGERQHTRDQVLAKRKANRERLRRWREQHDQDDE